MQERYDTPATALWSAAYHGNRALVEHLIAEGVDVNLSDRYGRSALIWAATGGYFELAKVLIAAGAWVDPYDDYSLFMSPLMCAAETGHIEIVDLLLAHGACPVRYGGWSQTTAQRYVRGDSADARLLSAVLLHAEDEWRRAHPRGGEV